ncbi:MAG: site-specific integrase [Lachnospiraceae bacterium]|nr:site-specific integrase [Lachnospiraceae bacterium]
MNDYDILRSAEALGIIDLDDIQVQIDMYEKKKYLEMHTNSIWQGKNGYWYTTIPATQEHGRKMVRRLNKEDLEEVIVDHYRGKIKNPTIRTIFEEWITEKKQWEEINQTTVDRYKGDFERFFGDTSFPNLKIDIVTEDYLESLIKNNIVQKQLTSKGYSNMKTILIGIMKYAKRKKYTYFSVSAFFGDLQISKKAFRRPEKKKQVFTEEEAEMVIEWLKEHPSVANYGILLVFQTGLREGELAALKYEDMDGCILNVRRQEVRYKDENGVMINEVVPYAKTEAGERGVILTDNALETIKKIRRLNPFGEYMMMQDGKKIHKISFNDYLYKACDALGIERRSMHKIRKTYGTMLIDSGADDSTVMEQMGHSDITTTRKFYYFSNKSQAEKIEQVKRAIVL